MAVLLALLIAAVQRVRETASRLKCQNNLKQMGLALHNYEGANGIFPPSYGQLAFGRPIRPDRPTYSWNVYLLPFLEETALFRKLDLRTSANVSPNLALAGELVPTFICPSDPAGGQQIRSGQQHAVDFFLDSAPATSGRNYMESGRVYDCRVNGRGPLGHCLTFPPASDAYRGAEPAVYGGGGVGFASALSNFGNAQWAGIHNVHRRLVDITDGTSATLAVGEMLPDCHNWSNWLYGDASDYSASNGINTYMRESCRFLGGDWLDWEAGRGFKSLHVEGVNVLLADGAVRFVRASIDIEVFQRLATIQSGDIASLE